MMLRRTAATAIGSTTQGVGAATARKVLRGAQDAPVRLAKYIEELSSYLRETRVLLDTAFSKGQRVDPNELPERTERKGLRRW
jgi:adenylosuccinate synthase